MTDPTASLSASALSEHVVVCGADHLALRTVRELRMRGEQVVLIAPDDVDPDEIALKNVPVVHGEQTHARVLRAAGVERASAVILATDNDLGNLNAALAAYEINPQARLVIRMFDTSLGPHLAGLFPRAIFLSSSALAAPGFVSAAVFGDGGERFTVGGRVLVARTAADTPLPGNAPERSIPIAILKKDRTVELLPNDESTGADNDAIVVDVFDPERVRPPVVSAPDKPSQTRTSDVARGMPKLVGERLQRPERRLVRFVGILVGLLVASALFFLVTSGVSPLDAIAYAITLLTGASLVTSIDPTTASPALKVYAIFLSLVGAALFAVVYALITDAIIRSRLLRTLGRRTVPSSTKDHVIVCGAGSIGYRVALGIADLNVPVVIVEADENGRFVAPARALGIPVVIGDARQPELLIEAGVMRARAVVAATSNDLANLSAALNARELRPALRVVLRLFDPDFAVRIQRGFAIRFTRSVSHLAAPAFAAAAMGSEVVATVPVGDRRVIFFARLRVPAGSRLVGQRVADLIQSGELRIVAVADPGSDVARWDYPADEILDPDEEVIAAATRAGLAHLLDLSRVPTPRADDDAGTARPHSRIVDQRR